MNKMLKSKTHVVFHYEWINNYKQTEIKVNKYLLEKRTFAWK